jgi:two-component system sensor histidine kinase YesM
LKALDLHFFNRFYRSSSLRITIIWFFLPVIVLFITLIGFLSYWIAAIQIRENAYVNIKDTVAQTKSYLDNRLLSIFEQLIVIQNDIDTLSMMRRLDTEENGNFSPEDYVKMMRNIEKVYSGYYTMLDSIFINFNDGKVQLYKKDDLVKKVDFSYLEWRRKFRGNPMDCYWTHLNTSPILRSLHQSERVVALFKLYGDRNTQIKGIILFALRESFFRDVLDKVKISNNGSLILLSREGMMSFKEIAPQYRINEVKLWELTRGSDSGTITIKSRQGRKTTVIFNTLQANHWKIAAVFPVNDILNRADFIKFFTLSVVGFLILSALVLSNILARMITEPMTRLTKKVELVEAGDLDVPFEIEGADEIGILNRGIRGLLTQVKRLLTQVKQEQEQKHRAELAVLQAQIKPHFLYNTLDSIKQLCEMGENQNAARMIYALARLYRIGLGGGKEIISIREEVEYVRSYLVIQQMRYDDHFEYTVNVDPGLEGYTILKLTLQPLVENAIYHGIKQSHQKGEIRIRAFRSENTLCFEVSDTGPGLAPEKLRQLQRELAVEGGVRQSGFGLSNVQQRLRLHYGKEYGLEISSVAGKGMTVHVKIPVLQEEEVHVPFSDYR